jgi:cytochrome P450
MLGSAIHVRRGLRFTRAWDRLDHLATELVQGPGPVATALRSLDVAPAERAAEARVILLAGAETIATALTWALLELARDPALADAVVQEGEPLAERVFAEVLRLYPPAWYIGRIAVADTELAGEPIAEGTMVLVSPYLLHRDERHFDRAATFDPGRWSEGTASAARAFTYLPFGAGPRRCIGEEIAWVEGRVILATLARSLALDLVDESPVAPFPGASLRPSRPVYLRARRRRPVATAVS